MSKLHKLAMLAGAAATAILISASANAQTTPTPDQDPPYETNDPEAMPQPTTPTVVVEQPAQTPVVVEQPAPVVAPAPVVVEEKPVVVVVPKRSRTHTLSAGGGISDFTDSTLRDRTSLNGAYEARLSIGINAPIAIEAAYVGTAAGLETLGLDDDAMLISNGVEGLARLNFGTFDVQPYVVGGASWVRYNVVNDSFNTSDVRDQDDVLAVPLGGGLSTYFGDGFMFDARFTYRMMFDDELIRPTSGNSDGSNLDNWMVTARLGYAF